MTFRRIVASLLLVLLPLAFVAIAEPPRASLDYGMMIFGYAPRWAQWTFGIAGVLVCAGFTGPAAIGCGLAGVA